MTLRLAGSTSGYTEIDAPAVAGNNTLVLPASNGSAGQLLKNGSTAGSLEFSNSVSIDSSNRLLVGTSSGDTKLYVYDATTPQATFNNGTSSFIVGNSSGGNNHILYGTGAYPMIFYTDSTERMRITSAGAVTFRSGTTADTSGDGTVFLDSSGSGSPVYLYFKKTFSGTRDAIDFRHNGTSVGQIQFTNTATAYNTSSDYRLKENVVEITDGITRLQQLKPSRFNFIADPDSTVDGFIAHEVQDVVPEAISGEKDAVDDEGNPKYQGIDQSKLVPLLTAALQEAIGEIESLKARVAALESA